MRRADAVRRAADLTAGACARVLGTLAAADGTYSDIVVDEEPGNPWTSFDYPLVTVRISWIEGISGANLFVIGSGQARALAAAMMGQDAPEDDDPLSEIELSAVAEAMNQMMGSVATAMSAALGVPTDIATPEAHVLAGADEVDPSFTEADYAASFTLAAGDVTASIVQLVGREFADVLASLFNAGDATREVLADRRTAGAATAGGDDTFSAVDRTARITADSSAQVLSTLIGGDASATLPSVEADPDDPLGTLAYPLIFVEVSYVAGVNGANLFVLSPDQAATLAAVMMGSDEPLGDGLSELELSAVSEAMNQMMGSATNILADTLRLEIEVAPPTCEVIAGPEEARARFDEPAFCTRFRLVSDRLTADVVQLVPADFAERLRRAFVAADHGRAAVAAPTGPTEAAGSAATAVATTARRPSPGAIDLDNVRRVEVRVSAELGRARLPVSRVVNLPPGSIVELDRAPHEPLALLVNGRPYASAKLVVVDGEYAVQLVALTPPRAAA